MGGLCLKFFTPNGDTWISRGDFGINAKAYVRVDKSETDKIEIIKKVLERYVKLTEKIYGRMSYEEFLTCFEYYGLDVVAINESELNENYKIIVENEKDFYVELEWRDELNNSFVLLVNCKCTKITNVICEENGIHKRKLELKNFKAYDGHRMKACIIIKKYKNFEKEKDYFVLKDIFDISDGVPPSMLKSHIKSKYNYEIVFGKINKEYQEEYNYLIKNSNYYTMDCTLIESKSHAILKINFNPKKLMLFI